MMTVAALDRLIHHRDDESTLIALTHMAWVYSSITAKSLNRDIKSRLSATGL